MTPLKGPHGIVHPVDNEAQLILAGGGLLAAGVVASAVAARVRLPALLLFLGLGMAVGTDGLGWIDFANYSLAHLVGTVALVLILFEGGLATGFRALRPVLGPSVSLAVIGTAGTALIAGIAASRLFHFSIATLPLIDHVPRSLEFFNLVFFAVLVSTLIQGATVELLANRLGMSAAETA